ncbi:transposase [Bradyrhizobium sp. CAR08]
MRHGTSASRPSRRSTRSNTRSACEAGLRRGVTSMDDAYGTDSRLRTRMTAFGVSYVAGIHPKIPVWPPGTGPRPRGRPLNNMGRRDEPHLISAKRLARDLPQKMPRIRCRWREGSAERLSSRFARVRVRSDVLSSGRNWCRGSGC